MMSIATRQELKDSLDDYNEKCKILKQIHSNKSGNYRKRHARMTIVTIAASVIMTSVGFIDKNRFVDFVYPRLTITSNTERDQLTQADKQKIIERRGKIESMTLMFDLSVLIVLTLSIVSLIYRWQERSVEHNKAVVILADLANDIDDLLKFSLLPDEDLYIKYEIIRAKYKVIADFLPQNSDEEFLQARKDYDEKRKSKS